MNPSVSFSSFFILLSKVLCLLFSTDAFSRAVLSPCSLSSSTVTYVRTVIAITISCLEN